jgi:tripeptide aminopeptidase
MSYPPIERERLINLFTRFATIDGLSLRERQIADEVSAVLRGAGIRVLEDSAGTRLNGTAGNLLCFSPGFNSNQPAIMLTAHLDTVLPTAKLKPAREEVRITSDGTTILGADNRVGVSVLAYLLLAVTEGKLPTKNFFVAFTIAEEVGLLGASTIDLSPYGVQSIFVFDCSRRPGVYIRECVGLSLFNARFVGKAAHAGVAPEEGVNAIALAGAGIAKLELGRIDQDMTVNIGKISGGEATNVVPDKVDIEGEVRSFSPKRIQEQLGLIERTLSQAVIGRGKLVFETKVDFPPYVHSHDSPIIRDVESALKAVGLQPQPIRYTGGSDANEYNAKGIPAVNLGIGAQKPHTFEEFVLIEDLVKSAEIAFMLLQHSTGT